MGAPWHSADTQNASDRSYGLRARQAADLLAQEAVARAARGARGGGEGWWGDWYASAVLGMATAALRARRALRVWGLDFLLPVGFF